MPHILPIRLREINLKQTGKIPPVGYLLLCQKGLRSLLRRKDIKGLTCHSMLHTAILICHSRMHLCWLVILMGWLHAFLYFGLSFSRGISMPSTAILDQDPLWGKLQALQHFMYFSDIIFINCQAVSWRLFIPSEPDYSQGNVCVCGGPRVSKKLECWVYIITYYSIHI